MPCIMANPNRDDLLSALYGETSGQQALAYVRMLWESDRWSNFSGYAETARAVQETFQAIGLDDVQRAETPADGKYRVGDWVMPLAWDCSDARLEIVSPAVANPVIARRFDQPNHVGMWSAPTPEGGLEADLIILQEGTVQEVQAKASQIMGKWVLTPRSAREIKTAVIQAGGAGTITSWVRNGDLKDAVGWSNGWSDRPGGWVYTASDTPLPCFVISKRQAEQLRKLQDEHGKVRLRGSIEARFYEGHLDYITARIAGRERPQEEVLVLGHLYEQGANDNCSGCAAILEMARSLAQLIESGRLPRPRRSIRFLLMAECYGSFAYAQDHRDRLRETLACACIDTGAGPVESARSKYQISIAPLCSRSFYEAVHIDTASAYLGQYRKGRALNVVDFSGGTDVYYNDPAVGVPTHWLMIEAVEDVWHNSADRLETLDERAYVDLVCVEGATLYRIANAAREDAADFARLTATYVKKSILDLVAQRACRSVLDVHAEAGAAAILSARRLSDDSKTPEQLARQFENFIAAETQLAEAAGWLDPETASRPTSDEDRLVPVRAGWHFGTVSLDPVPVEAWAEAGVTSSPRWGGARNLALWWADGNRTIAQIRQRVAAEASLGDLDLVGWFKFLEKHGYVELKKA